MWMDLVLWDYPRVLNACWWKILFSYQSPNPFSPSICSIDFGYLKEVQLIQIAVNSKHVLVFGPIVQATYWF